MNIVLLGAPGSGKGTQAEKLAERLNLYLFQTGELTRSLAKKDKRIQDIYDSGKLIPEGEMTMHVIDFLSKEIPDMHDILFEGFPRFISQYKALDNYLKSKGDDIDAIFSLDVSEDEAIRRISSRRICTKCGEVYNLVTNPPPKGKCGECGGELKQRTDSKPEAVKVRFEYYRDNTKKLIDYLDKKGKLTRINGEQEIDAVFKEIMSHLES